MRFFTFPMAVYPDPGSMVWTFKSMPICARRSLIDAVIPEIGGVFRVRNRTLSHTAASHTPSWLPSYGDCRICALALATLPVCPGVAYGS